MALGLEIPEQGTPLNNEPHSTQVLYEHTLIQGRTGPVRNTTSLIRSPGLLVQGRSTESVHCLLLTGTRPMHLAHLKA